MKQADWYVDIIDQLSGKKHRIWWVQRHAMVLSLDGRIFYIGNKSW